MKNSIIVLIVCSILTFSANAQIKIISNGNVGIGKDLPVQKLDINGSIRGNQTAGAINIQTDIGYTRIGSVNSCFSHFYTDLPFYYFNKGINVNGKITSYTSVDLVLCTSSNFYPRVTINSSNGNVGIGKTPDPAYMLDVNGDIASRGVKVTSDIRLKDNIRNMDHSLNRVIQLQPIQFNYKPNSTKYGQNNSSDSTTVDPEVNAAMNAYYKQNRYGFSAQEVQKVYPDLVTKDANGYLSVDYIGLIPALVVAIKEQQARISELEKKLNAISTNKSN